MNGEFKSEKIQSTRRLKTTNMSRKACPAPTQYFSILPTCTNILLPCHPARNDAAAVNAPWGSCRGIRIGT